MSPRTAGARLPMQAKPRSRSDGSFPVLQNGEPFPDKPPCCPLSKVLEWFSGVGPPTNAAVNQFAPHTCLAEARLGRLPGSGFAVLIERRSVANYRNFWVSRHGEIRLHAYSSRSIGIPALSHLPAGEGATPAVQMTVLLKIRFGPRR